MSQHGGPHAMHTRIMVLRDGSSFRARRIWAVNGVDVSLNLRITSDRVQADLSWGHGGYRP